MIKPLFNQLCRKKFLNSCLGSMGKKSLVVSFIFSLTFAAFAQQPNKIGTVSEFSNNMSINAGQANARISRERVLPTSDASLSAIINVNTTINGENRVLGVVKGSNASNVSFTITNGKLEGLAVMPDEEKAYQYSSDEQGNVYAEEVDIHEVMCIDYNNQPTTAARQTAIAAVPPPNSTVYTLQSLPGVVAVAYLDFDGEVVSNSRWNGGATINAQPGNFTEADITNIWKMISEDYRPFNINITTNRAVYNAAPMNRRMMCIFTPTNTAAPGAGGVAYLNSFSRNSDDSPCWVFNGGAKAAGEAGSHELGHTFNLSHDGRTSPSEAYYSGAGIWAPIMGVGYSRGLVQFSRGEYPSANQTQDDLAIIANTTNGFGYRADEAGNTVAAAKALVVGSTGTVTGSQNYGVIATRTDIDVYSFTTGGGTVSITANPSASYPDLDILLRLTNAAGTVITSANPTATGTGTGPTAITGLAASISTTLAAGTYYLHVDGTGQGDLTTGYSDYASLGEYTLSGTVPISTGNQLPTVSITSPVNNATFNAPATITINATASDPDGTVSSVAFYNGSTLLGADATSPFSFVWNNVAAGTYQLTAVATDNAGGTGTSSIINITVSTVVTLRDPENPATTVNGLDYSYYEGSWSVLPAFNSLTPVETGTVTNYDLTVRNRNDQFGFSFTGFINVPADGQYTFYTASDDGSKLYIGTTTVVSNDGLHGLAEQSGTIGLKAGKHSITVTFFEQGGGEQLNVSYAGPSIVKQPIPASALFRIPAGNVAPTVSITSPANGASFNAPANITINANAGDTDGTVSSVAFYNGSTLLSTDATSPYSFAWNNVAAGTYQLTAIATDNSGANTTSSMVTITVTTVVNQAPTVSITSPANGASFNAPANITINATAADADGTVSSVAFYNGSTLLTTDVTSPYSFAWSNVPAGSYQLTAIATDNSGTSTTSSVISITVNTVVNQAPTVSITSPSTNATFTAPASVTINATASDADGSVTSVAFYNGSTLLGTDASSPYSFSWTNVAAGSYQLTARATDNSGASTTSAIVSITVTSNNDVCANVPQYSENNGYVAGSNVKNEGSRYQCKPWPYSGWCNGASWAYAPGTGAYWTDAWTLVGSCTAIVNVQFDKPEAAIVSAPQPFTDETTVSLNNGELISSLTVYDIHGKEIVQMANMNAETINLGENLKPGMYTIRIVTQNGTFVNSLIKTE